MMDFIVDVEGYCFFCLETLSSPNVRSQSGTAQSLQYLSRYLKMNRKKIFNDEESIPPDLLATVEQSRLTSDLCDECGRLNKQFSKLFRHLEMTEIRITSCLNRIHKKFRLPEDTGKVKTFCSNDQLVEPETNGKRKIVQALRMEAMDCCLNKLSGNRPRVKLRKMKMTDIHRKKLDLKKSFQNSRTAQLQVATPAVNEKHSEQKLIKTDEEERQHHIYDSNRHDHADDDEGQDMDMDFKDFNEAEDGNEAGSHGNPAFEDGSLLMTSPLKAHKSKISYEGKFIKSNSDKYTCNECSKEYASYRAFLLHYQGKHLNIKFRCSPCGKEFATRAHFNYHQQSVHQRIRYKCDRCDVMFTAKTYLDSHRRSAHFGGRFPCQFCPMTFEKFKDRNKHIKVECQWSRGEMDEMNND